MGYSIKLLTLGIALLIMHGNHLLAMYVISITEVCCFSIDKNLATWLNSRSLLLTGSPPLLQVTTALREAGLESSNLIVGIDFTKSNEWTGMCK